LNRDQKAAVIEEVAGSIQESEAIFAVDYRGLSVPQAAELRTRLRDADASFTVVKNTLGERAADQAGAEGLKVFLTGPTAITFVRGDAAAAAKALTDLGRTTGTLAFKGGLLNGNALTVEQIGDIARLPSREVLIGRLVGMVAAPLTGLATSLNGLIGGIARQLQAIADQGLVPAGGASAPAPAAQGGAGGTPEEATPEQEEPKADPEAAPGTDTDAGDQDAEAPATPEDPGPHPDPAPAE
jgi:large subunit ribosomal protein L10